MTECKECGETISSRADQCPHCGVSNPGGWLTYTGVGGGGCLKFLGCLGVLILAGILFTMCFGAGAAI